MKTSSKIAIAAAAVGAWLLAKKKGAISGIGRAVRNDYYGAIIESEDGDYRVEFSIIPNNGTVRAEIFQRTASYIDPQNYDPQKMVEWFKWITVYGKDLQEAARKAKKVIEGYGSAISFEELGVGATKATVSYKRDFAQRYFADNHYTLNNFMPLNDFIELWANGKVKAMANGKVKLGDKKYMAPATNNMVRKLDSACAVEYYGIEFEPAHLVEQGFINPQHEDKYYRGMKVTDNRKVNWAFR